MFKAELANSILKQLNETSVAFDDYQNKNQLSCPTSCGKCCFKPNISCSPYELLPLALELIQSNQAEKYLEKIDKNKTDLCILLEVSDKDKGLGQCNQYKFRPFVCRVFGVAGRIDKAEKAEAIICPTLQEIHNTNLAITNPLLISEWKKKLETIHPELAGDEMPINLSLKKIIESLLLIKQIANWPLPENC